MCSWTILFWEIQESVVSIVMFFSHVCSLQNSNFCYLPLLFTRKGFYICCRLKTCYSGLHLSSNLSANFSLISNVASWSCNYHDTFILHHENLPFFSIVICFCAPFTLKPIFLFLLFLHSIF